MGVAVGHRRFGRRACVAATTVALLGVFAASRPAAAAAVKFDPNAVLKVGDFQVNNQVTVLDPRLTRSNNDSTWMSAMYAPLMSFDRKTNKFAPYLASTVTVVDNKTIKIELRADAKFDTGAPVTAADAKATIEASRENFRASKANGLRAELLLIDNVEVTSTTGFTIHLNAPGLGAIFDLLADRSTYIIPANAGATQNTKPVTNGAFKFVSFTQGQSIVLEKSTTFWDAKNVNLKGIQFINLLPGTPQTNALLAGDVQYAEDIDPSGLPALTGKFNTLKSINPEAYFYIDMCKLSSNFFGDLKIRQALAYGTDRAALAKIASGGTSVAAYEQIAPGDARFNPALPKLYKYNINKSKALLAQAGVKDGTQISLVVANSLAQFTPMGLILKDQWTKIGLTVNIVPTTDLVGAWINPALRSQPPSTTTLALNQASRAGLQKLTRYFGTNGPANPCNYQNTTLNQLMTDLNGLSPSDPQAVAKWKQAEQIAIGDDVAMIPTMYTPVVRAWSKSIGTTGAVNPLTYPLGSNQTTWQQVYIKASK